MLDTIKPGAQGGFSFAVGTAKVSVQQEGIPSASALFGSGKRFVTNQVEGEFGHLARPISFPAKSTIFAENEPSSAIYMLTRGTAGLYKMLVDGRRQIVGFALAGDFLGSPFSDRYACSVDTISVVAARQFARAQFLTSLRANPESLSLFLEAALQETNAARDHMLLLGRGTAEEKFAEFIINWRARIGRMGALSNLVPLPMSRRDIADFLGLTIETVSRVITRLERENVIRVTSEGFTGGFDGTAIVIRKKLQVIRYAVAWVEGFSRAWRSRWPRSGIGGITDMA